MAVIHIDPFPPRSSPGEVLKFIAERGGLDGRQIGKIALIGRGATVEIPGSESGGGGRGTRRRHFSRQAGPGSARRQGRFHRRQSLRQPLAPTRSRSARRTGRSTPLRQAEDGSAVGDGVTLTRLELREAEFGLGGRLLLTFGRKNVESLPPTRLQPGSPVVLSQTNVNRRMPSYRGVVFDRDGTHHRRGHRPAGRRTR